MEKRTVNDKEHFTEAFECDEKSVNLNSDNYKSNKSRFYRKPKQGNFFKSRTCSYFYSKGYCKFGEDCKFKHFNKENSDTHIVNEQSTVVTENVHKNSSENNNSLKDIKTQESSKQNTPVENLFKGDNYSSVEFCSDEIPRFNRSAIPLSQRIPSKTYTSINRQPRKRNKPLCYYYKKGSCYKGDSCKYHHIGNTINKTAVKVLEAPEETDDNHLLLFNKKKKEIVREESSAAKIPAVVSHKSLNIHDISSLTLDALFELRTTEINQLKKRFPRLEVIKENQSFSIMFQPSDPDWAFDVKSLKLEVSFPEKYPTEKCKITVIQNAEHIPGLLIKFLNKAICEWVDKKFEENNALNKTELIFRIFLKWFDKNLEDLFIAGLKKVKQDLKAKEDGIEFIPVENLFAASKNDTAEETLENFAVITTSQLQEQTPVSQQRNSEPLGSKNNKLSYSGENSGIKITLSSLELTESAAAFICTKISITLQCCRCKTPFNMKSTPKKNNNYVCSKCSKNVGFTFDPFTVHQFSSVLGYLYLNDCVAVDINLIECHFLVDCLSCSKQVPVDGIHYGQKHKMWCLFCNEKMLISIGCMKFHAAKLPSLPADAKYLLGKKSEKKVKDPVVKEGEPLPNFGACKHYKKSFRWLRFPCCGRLYPCDICHDEKETDHEMKYASRMICGFCAKEQPYSREKPCLLCSQNLTKKSGSHWEGGKGCRNKIQMSREDKQKYSGVSKTISRKAQTTKLKKKH